VSKCQGSVLEFNLIRGKVEQLSKEIEQEQSYSFLVLCLMQYLSIDQFTAEDSITDGADDCGIDAVYYDADNPNGPVIYLFQTKYYQADKYDREFDGNAIDKLLHSVEVLFLQGKKRGKYINDSLKEKLKQYDDEFSGAVPNLS
jgi:hypothetical protein